MNGRPRSVPRYANSMIVENSQSRIRVSPEPSYSRTYIEDNPYRGQHTQPDFMGASRREIAAASQSKIEVNKSIVHSPYDSFVSRQKASNITNSGGRYRTSNIVQNSDLGYEGSSSTLQSRRYGNNNTVFEDVNPRLLESHIKEEIQEDLVTSNLNDESPEFDFERRLDQGHPIGQSLRPIILKNPWYALCEILDFNEKARKQTGITLQKNGGWTSNYHPIGNLLPLMNQAPVCRTAQCLSPLAQNILVPNPSYPLHSYECYNSQAYSPYQFPLQYPTPYSAQGYSFQGYQSSPQQSYWQGGYEWVQPQFAQGRGYQNQTNYYYY